MCLYAAKRYPEAIRQAVRTTELSPDLVYYDVTDAASYRQMGQYEQAVSLYRKAQPHSNKPLFGLGVTFAQMGRRDSALRVAHDLEKLSRTRYVSPALIAMIYANLPVPADRDLAFKWIAEGQRIHSAVNLFLHVSPEFDPLRGDPRFVEILRQMDSRRVATP
jgi:tetratricopeptide (TPR) repeat protein